MVCVGPRSAYVRPMLAYVGLGWAYVGPMLAYVGSMLAYVGFMLSHLGGYGGHMLGICWAILGLCWGYVKQLMCSTHTKCRLSLSARHATDTTGALLGESRGRRRQRNTVKNDVFEHPAQKAW